MNTVAQVPTFPRNRLSLAFPAAVPFVLGTGTALACYGASGTTLGLFFGPVLLLPFLAPAMALSEKTFRARLVAIGALAFGIWLVWLFIGSTRISEALRCGLVLAAWVFALAGFASLLNATGLHPVFASALATALALAWLTWPVWLSHFLTGQSAPLLLTAPHPLLSLNGVLLNHFNAWDRDPLAYRDLTTLNQDILFTMPPSVWPMVISHVTLGSVGFAIAHRRGRKRVA